MKQNTKSDYVTVEMLVKQKEDKYQGVVFGIELDKTYENAKYSVDPVNLCSGNFILNNEDIKVNGRFPIIFKRF